MLKNGRLVNPEVRIESTNLCNANCIICPRDRLTRKLTTMPYENFVDLANQCKDLGAETISLFDFGEPLLDPKIYDKVRYTKDLGLQTFMTSNGNILTESRRKKLIDSGLDHIRFSVHGIEKNYEKVHNLEWKTTFSNIFNFCKEASCIIDVSIIPMFNDSISALVNFWKNIGVDGIEVWAPHNWTNGKRFRTVEKQKKTCGRPFNGPLQIQADGAIKLCCFDFDGKTAFGNVFFDKITDTFDHYKYILYRNRHTTGELGGMICDNCDQLNADNDNTLLYSNIDPSRELNKTSSCKIKIGE